MTRKGPYGSPENMTVLDVTEKAVVTEVHVRVDPKKEGHRHNLKWNKPKLC